MHWWLDIEEADGTKAGPGPLRSATSFEVTRRLDAAGKFKARASLAEERASIAQAKRRARAWGLMDGTVTDLGAGIIDKISVDADLNLDLSGDDLLRELTYRQVGRLLIGASGAPSTTGPAQIAALFPSGWSLDIVNGYDETLKAIHHRFEGESCLAALCKLAEITGEHFRLGAGCTVVWMQKDQPVSGVRAIRGGEPIALESNAEVCVITDLKDNQDSYDCLIGRVYAHGVGNGDARITLNGASISTPGWTVGSDTKGYYLEHTATWTAYGIERYSSFKDISDQDTLVEVTYEWMLRRLALQQAYEIFIDKLDQELLAGSSLRVVYRRVLDGVTVLDIDANLVVLETTVRVDAQGVHTTGLKVATIDMWPDNTASASMSGMNNSRDNYSYTQPVEVTAHHTSHENGGSDSIKLDDLATPDDNMDLDATIVQHGLLPKLSGDGGDVLLGDGKWGAGTPLLFTVEEQDGVPSISNVNTIKVSDGSLTDDGAGVVSLVTGGGGGAANFVDLGDVPATYIGGCGKIVAVKGTEDGLEFIDPIVPGAGLDAYIGTEIYREVVASGGVANVTIDNIDGNYDELVITVMGKSEKAAQGDTVNITINDDTTTTNYYYAQLYGGTTHGSNSADGRHIGNIGGATYPYDLGTFKIYIPNYASTTLQKVCYSVGGNRDGATNANNAIVTNWWESTSAITKIMLTPVGGDFAEGTLVSVIGYKNTNIVGAGTPMALTIEEQDGAPSVANITKIKVANGSLTDDGGGVVSLVTGGGGGVLDGSGVANQVALWADSDTLSGDTGFTFDPVTDELMVGGIVTLEPGAGLAGIVLDPNGCLSASGEHVLKLVLPPSPASMSADATLILPIRDMTLTSGVSTFSIMGGGKTLTVNDTGVAALQNVANTFTKTNEFAPTSGEIVVSVRTATGAGVFAANTTNKAVGIGDRLIPTYKLDVNYDTDSNWLDTVIGVTSVARNCGTYPLAGFGLAIRYYLGTYVHDDQLAGATKYTWADPIDATRKAQGIFTIYDASAERECFRIETDGSKPMIGFLGANASARSTGWAVSNLTPDKVYDADDTSTDELADVLGTLITELLAKGLLGA